MKHVSLWFNPNSSRMVGPFPKQKCSLKDTPGETHVKYFSPSTPVKRLISETSDAESSGEVIVTSKQDQNHENGSV